ncbi:MAG TPA: hypothetical protein VKB38_09030 [Terracidiphilus sp.]|nr:hypothetical protein [Terracidiphilus sp.]
MRDERQQEPHTFIPYEKSRARRMARKLGLRVICSRSDIGPSAPALEDRAEGKQGGQSHQKHANPVVLKKMMEKMAG